MKQAKSRFASIKNDFITFPSYIIWSPFKGFDDMKYYRMGKLHYAYVMMAVYCLFKMCDTLFKGFAFTMYYAETRYINVPYMALMTVTPVALFVVGNWSITAITDGKGRLREIFMVYAYALYPKIILSVIGLVISNVITVDERVFATFFYAFADICFWIYLFVGLIVIHEYTFTKAVIMMVLTFVSMAIIAFVAALLSSLWGEFATFIQVVFTELRMKF